MLLLVSGLKDNKEGGALQRRKGNAEMRCWFAGLQKARFVSGRRWKCSLLFVRVLSVYPSSSSICRGLTADALAASC